NELLMVSRVKAPQIEPMAR
ncbi:hypothetical protein D046_2294, partial [Vibrio parahaemolyticus V-223/04]